MKILQNLRSRLILRNSSRERDDAEKSDSVKFQHFAPPFQHLPTE